MGQPPVLRHAIEQTFHTNLELFASPHNCSMEPGITYGFAVAEDSVCGALHNAHNYK